MTLVYVAYHLQCQKFQSVSHKAYPSFGMVLVHNDTNYSFHFMMLYWLCIYQPIWQHMLEGYNIKVIIKNNPNFSRFFFQSTTPSLKLVTYFNLCYMVTDRCNKSNYSLLFLLCNWWDCGRRWRKGITKGPLSHVILTSKTAMKYGHTCFQNKQTSIQNIMWKVRSSEKG